VSLASPVSTVVRPGAAVRFVRRQRYSLYLASDGEWYLGYRRCNAVGASICGTVQPVSGPYRPYNRLQRATGLLFEYFDAAGERVDVAASPLAIARIDITARTKSDYKLPRGTVFGRGISDSATLSVAIQNWTR
jgi:hypothetical protein